MARFQILAVLVAIVTAAAPTVARAQYNGSPLLNEPALRRKGMTRAWYRQIEIDRTRDRIENVTVDEGTLFVQTKRGTINALDGETGKKLWVRRIGSVNYATSAVGAGKNYVAVLNGSTLYLLSRATGKLVWERRIHGAPGAAPGISQDHVIVPTVRGVIEGYSLKDTEEPVWRYSSSGRAVVQPYVAKGSVSWPTDRGLFYVMAGDRLVPRFKVEARKSIVAGPAYIEPYLFFGSLDGYLYKVHEKSGIIYWRFSAGVPVSQKPIAVKDRVYVVTEGGGLYCVLGISDEAEIDDIEDDIGKVRQLDGKPEEGEEIWWAPRVARILAVSASRIYVLDKRGRILFLRQKDGGLIDSIGARHLDLRVVNDQTDRIYLGTRTGLIQCIHELAQKEPIRHVQRETPLLGPKEGIQDEGDDGKKPAAKEEPEEDLFGEGGDKKGKDGDPFAEDPVPGKAGGGDKDGDDGKKPAGDPFGGDDPF